ncbi:phosphatidate cytidylyltransferase (CDP-diacylglycerol synthase) [Candidatus Methylomirabilis lanthanidiphila]|uniref:Phosphatidate cytidylyltransferase n=1 Tax=Candidatus Methylomirabilis lanthanidiphila TaxID=2211376 RepID=A0A564ZKS4_9BACT|nr:phosphatidate cytidylyltransferase [Candidatus Methylomirabilis lanthanidiphila]VUZ85252.1 phosphatidate cytidylyltransferase (CDP-diacylglycerol synthase) [Candidatus Methylomirabilis lanthanidiphila]
MHLKRILSAAILLPAFLLLVQFGTALHFFLLVALAILVGLHEFYGMAEAGGWHPLTSLGMGCGVALSCVEFFGAPAPWLISIFAGVMILLLITLLVEGTEQKETALRGAITLFGLIYVAVLLSFPALLRAMELGRAYIFYLVFVTWAGDTGAFYVGSTMGKRLLCPSISPRKTVEGSVGGLVCSIVASGLAKLWFWEGLGAVEVVVMGLGLGAMGQVGDLCESMLKRSFGVKDTGALIPGHGGLLDRVDSLLFTAPVLYVAALAGWV